MAVDTLAVLHIPHGPAIAIPGIPAESLWEFVSAVLTALVVWWLARGRIKTERWQERQAEEYHKLVDALYVIQEYTGLRATEMERVRVMSEEWTEPPPDIDENMYEALRPGFEEADRVVTRHAAVGPFLLTPAAVTILRKYVSDCEEMNQSETWYGFEWWHGIAENCWAAFANRARYDLGQIHWPTYTWHRVRQWSKRLRALWLGRWQGFKSWSATRYDQRQLPRPGGRK